MQTRQHSTEYRVAGLATALALFLCSCALDSQDVVSDRFVTGSDAELAIMRSRQQVAKQVTTEVAIPCDDPITVRGERALEVQVATIHDGFAVLGFGASQIGVFAILQSLASTSESTTDMRDQADYLEKLEQAWPEPAAFVVRDGRLYTVNKRARDWAPNAAHDTTGFSYRDIRDAVISREQVPGFHD